MQHHMVEKSQIVAHLRLFLHFHHSCSGAVKDQLLVVSDVMEFVVMQQPLELL